MPIIELETKIKANIVRCFDLSRSIELHLLSTKGTREEAIAGTTKGLIGLNESVTWKATHLPIIYGTSCLKGTAFLKNVQRMTPQILKEW